MMSLRRARGRVCNRAISRSDRVRKIARGCARRTISAHAILHTLRSGAMAEKASMAEAHYRAGEPTHFDNSQEADQ
jgi:hypothetical protein